MRKEDDDGQKKRIKVLLSAVLRDDGIRNTEREKEIYTTFWRKSTPFREMNPIQFHLDLLLLFILTFLPPPTPAEDILWFFCLKREGRRKGGERGGGGRGRRLFNKEERQNLSSRLPLSWCRRSKIVLKFRSFRAKFHQRRRRKKREKIHKIKKVFRVSLLLYFLQGCGQL